MTQLILASASPYRKQLLTRLGIDFSVSSQNIDETRLAGESPLRLVKRLARKKAQSALADISNGNSVSSTSHGKYTVIIGSDQVGALNTRILGKPANFEDAVEQLQLLSGTVVEFFTAVCLLRSDSDEAIEFIDTTRVVFRELNLDEIISYIKREQPYGSCGSFQVEGLGISLVEKINSNDPTALIGLPLIRLYQSLRQWRVVD